MKLEPMIAAGENGDFADENTVVAEPTEKFMTFRLGSEWYALRIELAREVVRAKKITYLPGAPSHVVGLLSLRGNLLSITDPRRLLQLTASPSHAQPKVIVVDNGTVNAGLLVDEVGEVMSVPISQLEPPLATMDTGSAGLIEHTVRWGDHIMAVIKAEPFLGCTESTLKES
jgi:purine-binding chemotaxis protein CheW